MGSACDLVVPDAVGSAGVQSPKPYFFQNFDLIKTKKINRCETSTRGA